MEQKLFWRSILLRLKGTVSRSHFVTWFQNTAIVEDTEERIVVGVPTAFARDWLTQKYAVKVLQAAQELQPGLKDVTFRIEAELATGTDARTLDVRKLEDEGSTEQAGEKHVRKVRGEQRVMVTSGGAVSASLNPRFTMRGFVPGEENRLAHAAALSVARLPGQTYNPLVIYGGVGLGKTHLLTAIGHETLLNDPTKKVVFMTSELFTSEYGAACKAMRADDFMRRYRDADVFLMDDVQFLAGRDRTQEAFFNLFNVLHSAGKQICVTSDRPPSELTDIMDRIKSRFVWGLVAEIEQPKFASRLEILKSKTRERRAILDPEVVEFIALNVSSSVRALEGVLTRALAESELLDRPPTVRRLAQIIEQLDRREMLVGAPGTAVARPQTACEILTLVARHFALSPEALKSESRTKDIKTARGVAMYLIRQVLGSSLHDIGTVFDRNHTTTLHAIHRITEDLKKDAELLSRVNAVKAEAGL